MKLITYAAVRPGMQALGSYSVRLGTNSIFSHTEIVFEEGDDVAKYMPDGSAAMDEEGTLWCASATAADTIPALSRRRAGRKGGIRFKRIKVGDHWLVQNLDGLADPVRAAAWFAENEGLAYDWMGIAGYAGAISNLIFGHSERKYSCTEACAAALGFPDADRFHPANLPPVIARMNEMLDGKNSIMDYVVELHRLRNAKRTS